jgi:O-glycosyl hydrolase
MSAAAAVLICLLPELSYQTLLGFGQGNMDQQTVPWYTQLSAAQREQWLDHLYTTQDGGLGLQIARVYLCAGDAPGHHHMDRHPGGSGAPLGYSAGPGQWLWDGHDASLWAARGARDRGAHLVAFFNSPPYWMTVSGCTSGSKGGKTNNLAVEHEDDYVAYMVEVLRHYRDAWGIDFEWVCPINEPEADWWTEGDGQDGCHTDAAQARRLVARLGPALRAAGLRAKTTAFEAAFGGSLGYLDQLLADPAAGPQIGLLSTHQYQANEHDLRQWALRARRSQRPVWMSEWGDWKLRGMPQALGYSAKVAQALRFLQCEAWCCWEPGLLVDRAGGEIKRRKAWFMLAQYSAWLRPGMTCIESLDGGGISSTAALDAARHEAVMVLSNPAASAMSVALDTSHLSGFHVTAVTRTSADEDLAPQDKGDGALYVLPPTSVTTLVGAYDAVAPGPVVNPGFETGDARGWTVVGNGGVQSEYPQGGCFDGYLSPSEQQGAALRQTLAGLAPGRRYRLAAACASSDIDVRLVARSGGREAAATTRGGGYRQCLVEFTAGGDGRAEIAYESPPARRGAWATLDNVFVGGM